VSGNGGAYKLIADTVQVGQPVNSASPLSGNWALNRVLQVRRECPMSHSQ